MLFQSTSYNIFFPINNNIRRSVFEIEDSLKDFFPPPFTLLPIPENAPEEIPRINAISKHGHTALNISLTTAQLTTQFDDNFNKDWSKCQSYLNDRIEKLFDVVESLLKTKAIYSGFITEFFLEEEKEEPLILILNNFFKEKLFKSSNPLDVSFKFAFEIEKKYYLNVTVSNQRLYEGSTSKALSLADMKLKSHLIKVTMDVNDRFSYNFNKDYVPEL